MTTTLEPATTGPVTPSPETCAELLQVWKNRLRNQVTPATIRIYEGGVRRWITWFTDINGDEPIAADLTARSVNRWLDACQAGEGLPEPLSPGTCRARHQAIRQFSKWITDDTGDENARDPLLKVTAPRGGQREVNALTDEEVAAMLAACKSPRGASRWTRFEDLRDEAAFRLFLNCGLRASECAALTVDDVDMATHTVRVRRGKGGKPRTVKMGPKTEKAISDYLRHGRKGHQYEDLPALWLGSPNKPSWTYHGVWQAMRRRARIASVPGFHCHRLRHTCASRLLAAGMPEGEVMNMLGWSSRVMLDRYSKDTAAQRALATADRIYGKDRKGDW